MSTQVQKDAAVAEAKEAVVLAQKVRDEARPDQVVKADKELAEAKAKQVEAEAEVVA